MHNPSLKADDQAAIESPAHPSLREAVFTWIKVAALSFGGPAGQIAVMHRILVEEKRWISESRFLHALNYCMLLPGPEAQQLATNIGWMLHRTRGGLIAGGLFILPGFVSILILSILYAAYHNTGFVQGLFFGLKPAVMVIVVEAVMRIGRRALRNRLMLAIAAAAFIALFFFTVPFPAVILSAGLIGLIGSKYRPDLFTIKSTHALPVNEALIHDHSAAHTRPTFRRAVFVSAIGLTLWFAPVILLNASLGTDHVLSRESVFFSKAAVVTFGGAYAVLPYVAQQAVEKHGWLEPGEMLDGLGMAETTPGPLIMVVQFVGHLGAYRHMTEWPAAWAGVAGACITVWVTFVPCFLWIFLGAPYVEQVRRHARLSAILSAITAAVVGVILNLAIWFALHVLFDRIEETDIGPIRLLIPDWTTLSFPALGLAIAAAVALLWRQWNMILVIALSGAIGLLWAMIRP